MNLTTKQKKDLREIITAFKQFNQEKIDKDWIIKPIIGLYTITATGDALGFGIRFYEEMFDKPEYLGQGLTFNPVQIIK